MIKDKTKFTTLSLTNDNIDTIAKLKGVYIFDSITPSGGQYYLNIGCTDNLQRTAKAFYDYIQTTVINDVELSVSFYLCEDKENCNDISNKLNMQYKSKFSDPINMRDKLIKDLESQYE